MIVVKEGEGIVRSAKFVQPKEGSRPNPAKPAAPPKPGSSAE
jgi:hypothetical protein